MIVSSLAEAVAPVTMKTIESRSIEFSTVAPSCAMKFSVRFSAPFERL